MDENEEKLKKNIDEKLGDFDAVPCLWDPAGNTCTRECPNFYEAAGGLVVHAERNLMSLTDAGSRIRKRARRLDAIGLADYRRTLTLRGINLEQCLQKNNILSTLKCGVSSLRKNVYSRSIHPRPWRGILECSYKRPPLNP